MVVAWTKLLPENWPGRTEESHEHLIQNSGTETLRTGFPFSVQWYYVSLAVYGHRRRVICN
jgi:hypothetical protein